MKKKKFSIYLMVIVSIFFTVFLVGCNEDLEAESKETLLEGTEQGEEVPEREEKKGGTIVLGTSGEPVILNDLYHQDSVSGDVTSLLFAGLTYTDENLEVKPLIAKDHPSISDDGLEWTYEIKEDVLFHDGEELTADDVVFTFNIFLDEGYTGVRAGSFSSLERVEAVNKYTVKFTLTQPDARFHRLTGYSILPKHILGDIPVGELEEYHEFNLKNPVGAGPFKFEAWEPGQSLRLVAHEDYFEGRPYLDAITFRFASDTNALVLLLETGDIDFMVAPTNELATIETYEHVKLSSTLALQYDYIGWNLQNPLFEDVKVRQALTHAINRQEMAETIMEGYAEVAHAPVSPLSWAYNENVTKFEYNPQLAKELLYDAGWELGTDGILEKDGLKFSFTILSNDDSTVRRDIGIIVQQYLSEVGIEVRAEQMEWGAFLDKIDPPAYDFDAIVLAWGLAVDPDPSAIWHSREIESGLNNISYHNERVDEISDLNTSVVDQKEREELLSEVWEILAEEQPYTFLFYPYQFIAMNNNLQGFIHHPRIDMYKVNEWWISK